MNATVKRFMARGCLGLGLDRIIRRTAQGRFVILMFHRVVSPATLKASANASLMVTEEFFRALAETLAGRCHCLPLRQAVALAGVGAEYAKPVVAITFDDGYGDFYDAVFPVLRKLGLPATMFLSTGYLDQPERSFWWDAAEAFLAGSRDLERFARAGLPVAFWRDLRAVAASPSPERISAFIRGSLRRLDPADRTRFLGLLPPASHGRPAMLNWPQVRAMAATGLVDFAAHCVTHPLLAELDCTNAMAEIAASKQRIEEETGRPVTAFAYPGGSIPLFYKDALTQVGIDLAVTTRFGGNDGRSDPLLLRRVDARLCGPNGAFDPAYCLAVCSGCFDWLHDLRERRDALVH